MKKLFTKEEIDGVIYNYTILKQGRKKAGEPFGLSEKQVKRLLEENDIELRHINTRPNGGTRTYNIDDDYFDEQGSNIAYILGLWAADGNVHKTENRLDLELASCDMEILEKIKEELKSERSIKVYQCANGYEKNKLLFWSSKIKKVFISYGIVPNKTYSKDFSLPYNLDKKYWIDYIRGFFDGDGCIKKTGYSITFELNSINHSFLKGIQNFFEEYYQITTQITTTGGEGTCRNVPMYRLYCYGDMARKVFNHLYTPNSLYLKRKHDKWLELL